VQPFEKKDERSIKDVTIIAWKAFDIVSNDSRISICRFTICNIDYCWGNILMSGKPLRQDSFCMPHSWHIGVPLSATVSNHIGNFTDWSTNPPAPSSTFLLFPLYELVRRQPHLLVLIPFPQLDRWMPDLPCTISDYTHMIIISNSSDLAHFNTSSWR